MKGGEMMELVTMSREHYEEAIRDNTAVRMVLEYLDECESNEEQPDTNWLRFLLNGGPMDYWPEILREEDCPEEPRTHKKKTPRTAMQDVDEEDMIMR